VYDDGHAHCYACGFHDGAYTGPSETTAVKKPVSTMIGGIIKDLPHRSINKATCEKFGYQTAKLDGRVVELAFYRRDGEIVGQKVRYTDKKDFYSRGSMAAVQLWGQHLWEPGERLVITEGEIDAMSVSMIQDNRWPVVSIPSGSTNAANAIRRNMDWVSRFKTIVLCFDMDEPGRKAAEEVAALFPPGKVRIAELPLKDPNDMLRAGRGQELRSCLWNAQSYRMDGIIHASEVQWPEVGDREIFDYPWDSLNDYFIGCRPGEISLWTSGTGSGKSTMFREMAFHHLSMGRSVGMMMLEESPHETVDDLLSLMLQVPIRRIRNEQQLNELRRRQGKEPRPIANEFSMGEYESAKKKLFEKKLFIRCGMNVIGFADLLLNRMPGLYRVRDWKSRSTKTHPFVLSKDFQGRLYAGMVYRLFPDADEVEFSHYYPPIAEEVVVPITREQGEEAISRLRAVRDMAHHDTVWEPAKGTQCGSCAFKPYCPAWAQSDEERILAEMTKGI